MISNSRKIQLLHISVIFFFHSWETVKIWACHSWPCVIAAAETGDTKICVQVSAPEQRGLQITTRGFQLRFYCPETWEKLMAYVITPKPRLAWRSEEKCVSKSSHKSSALSFQKSLWFWQRRKGGFVVWRFTYHISDALVPGGDMGFSSAYCLRTVSRWWRVNNH